jgi:hypothetical protein
MQLRLPFIICLFWAIGLPAQAQQVVFNFTGAVQTWIVPAGVTSITVDARGGQGGGNASDSTVVGGYGGRVQTTIDVTPGETLTIYVGGRGGNLIPPNTGGPGGFNGGGTGGTDNVDGNGPSAGGAGASDVRQGGNDLTHRVVVAGGGGGAEGYEDGNGGNGGGLIGAAGGSSGFSSPGGGGTQSIGGTGGDSGGASGELGQGGVGGDGNRAGGGGGGGYYGGGGGGGGFLGSGGGGGSSYSSGSGTIHTQGYQSGDGEVVITFVNSESPFLGFPLMNKTSSTARINAVFDHSMFISQGGTQQYGYCPDDVVTAYTGETGMFPYASSPDPVGTFICGIPQQHQVMLYGWEQESGLSFRVNGNYVGLLEPQYLFYDGHPGFDYVTKDQKPDGSLCTKNMYCNSTAQTPVLAAANGTVVCVNISATKKPPCIEGPGEIKINHANGYFTIYLHLSSALVAANDTITQGQQIGVSGDTGAPEGGAHLHFEVRERKNSTDNICALPTTCVPVDPYGWMGTGKDPYNRAVNVNLWQ